VIPAILFVVSVIALLIVASIYARRITAHIANQEAVEATKKFQLEIIAKAAAKKQQADEQADKDKAAVHDMDTAELERKVNE
jgi:hypothetical protein